MKLVILLLLICVSCVKNRSQNKLFPMLRPGGIHTIDKECKKINSTGDLEVELIELEKHNQSVLRIISEGLDENDAHELSVLAENIEHHSGKIIELSKTEWTRINLKYNMEWKLTEADFGKNLIYDFKLTKIFLQGKERPDLMKEIFYRQLKDNNIVEVKSTLMGSLLDYCQLNKTLMIVFEYKQKHFGEEVTKLMNLHLQVEKK